jgi:gas vesicle protein
MSDWTKIVESLASGLLTGGVTALATILATFRDIRNRIAILEERLGSPPYNTAPGTGLFHTVGLLDSALTKMRKEIESWEDDPPAWMTRLVSRAGRSGSVNQELQQEFEERIMSRLRTFQERMDRMDDRIRDENRPGIPRSEYEADQKHLSEEMAQFRETQAASNGLLRGIMSAMGVIDKKTEPTSPVRPTKRGGI